MVDLKIMRVVWPAFLAACVLELVVFAMVDPQDLRWFARPLPLSREAAYTVSFFVFWAIGIGSSALTVLLARPAAEVNACPFVASERPPGCPRQ